MVGVNGQADMQWYTYCRDICSKEMLSILMEIGGEGHVVGIDETSLKKKSKYNRGHHYWLFGGVDRTTNHWFGIVTYEDRTKPTLSALIKEHMKAGTTIMSDQIALYVSMNGKHTLANNRLLRDKNYKHLWVNHSKTYVDPATGTHTNRIEGAWKIRAKHHAIRGMKKALLPMYLDEYLWRSWFTPPQATQSDVLRSLVTGIVKYYY
ncbi:hypothetical protein PF002_g13577 [Phytophthora fragariae]|uniref:ISXO2-like transposase domain-containing protein n=2 Tax=Phytophthora fragariae TaxID=53985 RepID=A0A6A3SDJ9_9STRA|nr:hypothetical protein PF003_g7251 [Phytophthora fragariae]KAE8936998.1 hypothetical protein PF009_g13087 [Phytophthora fragariae]KAE9111377.1 hypothetical protein PF007_g11504 [Phytophthora fragariae]KAE9228315.1 hypothetical protein PF002_g13577 [Phytophthora fragariae]